MDYYCKLSIFDNCCLNVVIMFTLVMSSGSLFHSSEVCRIKEFWSDEVLARGINCLAATIDLCCYKYCGYCDIPPHVGSRQRSSDEKGSSLID